MKEDEVTLRNGLERLGLSASDTHIEQLLRYAEELTQWNQHTNLIGRNTVDVMVSRHLLDSLSIAPYLHGTHILDLGTGAGLPGIPLAILHPDKPFTLLDSRGKKVRFLAHVRTTLALLNVKVVELRAQHYPIERGFDTITTRAFGSLSAIEEAAAHLCHRDGVILAMKGKYPTQELSSIKHTTIIHPIKVPYLDAERHLVLMEPHA